MPFLPESLARAGQLDFLSTSERLALNHIRGNGYLCMFGIFEEFILPFVLDHARSELQSSDQSLRAFLAFAGEEAKHMQLFRRFREEFERGFGSACVVIGPAERIGRAILSHHPLAVALIVLHSEWMTQRHYVESVKDNRTLDPQFRSLLKHHWMEEAQHAKLDTLMIDSFVAAATQQEIDRAFDEYIEIAKFLEIGLNQQVELDLLSLSQVTRRKFSAAEREKFLEVQRKALRWTFLGSGMTHPNFIATVEYLHPSASERLPHIAATHW
jgi:hypothetical protein